MLTQDQHAQTAMDFLDKADRHFADGDQIQASEKLWGAAAQAIMAASPSDAQCSRNHLELTSVAEKLAVEHGNPLIASGFSISRMYYHDSHHAHLLLSREEWLEDRPKVGDFVVRVLSLRGDGTLNGQA